MDYLMIIDNATGERQMMALVDAASHTYIDADDITRSLRSFGICTSIDHTIFDIEAADDILAA